MNGFLYMQPVPFMAPEGAMKSPPKPVLWLLIRLHPKRRARIATAARRRRETVAQRLGGVGQHGQACRHVFAVVLAVSLACAALLPGRSAIVVHWKRLTSRSLTGNHMVSYD